MNIELSVMSSKVILIQPVSFLSILTVFSSSWRLKQRFQSCFELAYMTLIVIKVCQSCWTILKKLLSGWMIWANLIYRNPKRIMNWSGYLKVFWIPISVLLSLSCNRIKFWFTFSRDYVTHFNLVEALEFGHPCIHVAKKIASVIDCLKYFDKDCKPKEQPQKRLFKKCSYYIINLCIDLIRIELLWHFA